jgi:hypothetical protein
MSSEEVNIGRSFSPQISQIGADEKQGIALRKMGVGA